MSSGEIDGSEKEWAHGSCCTAPADDQGILWPNGVSHARSGQDGTPTYVGSSQQRVAGPNYGTSVENKVPVGILDRSRNVSCSSGPLYVPLEAAECATWEKVLWKKQPFPDNYTDEKFLQELVVNAHVPTRDYWQVVLGSAAVSQQLSAVMAAACVTVHLRIGSFPASALLMVCAVQLCIGYAICCLVGGHVLGGSLTRGIRQGLLLTGGVYLLSPLLHSLTRSISEDSIIAMAVGLLILHLYLHDYNFVNSVTDMLTGAVSLGAAVHASVLMARLLPQESDVFAHILFCLELYLLFPFMRRYIRQASITAHVVLTVTMVTMALLLLWPLSRWLAALFLSIILAVSFLCPRWLVSIHKFKAKINGPWDEAVPLLGTNVKMQLQQRQSDRGQGLH